MPDSIPTSIANNILKNLSLPNVRVFPEIIDIMYIMSIYKKATIIPTNQPFLFIFLEEYIVPYIILKIVMERYIVELIPSFIFLNVNITANIKSIITVNITALKTPCKMEFE